MTNGMLCGPRTCRGAALLETLIAVTMLAIAGVGMVAHVAQTVDSVRQVNQRDRQTRAAAAEMERALLWTHADLRSRVGQSRVPCCRLVVQPASQVLYDLALTDTLTGAVILETTLYAPPTP